jgi:hypothetical protein
LEDTVSIVSTGRPGTANRRNGAERRGPLTAEGKAVASRNALRHGLSRPLSRSIGPVAEQIAEFARQLVGEEAPQSERDLATIAAEAISIWFASKSSVRSWSRKRFVVRLRHIRRLWADWTGSIVTSGAQKDAGARRCVDYRSIVGSRYSSSGWSCPPWAGTNNEHKTLFWQNEPIFR